MGSRGKDVPADVQFFFVEKLILSGAIFRSLFPICAVSGGKSVLAGAPRFVLPDLNPLGCRGGGDSAPPLVFCKLLEKNSD